jgi:hypothetical protein
MRAGLLGWAALALSAGLAAGAALADPSTQTYHLDGVIGTHAIGATIVVRDASHIDGGHYFYDSQLKDIPLTGAVHGRSVTLATATGETFSLTLQGNGGTGGDGASFETSTALVGTWTKGGQTLPVKLGMDFVTQGTPDGRMYGDVTSASDAAFEALVGRFIKAALAGDKTAAAAAVSYPLRVNGAHSLKIRNAAALISHWNGIFTPALLAQLRGAVPHEMFVRNGQAMVAGGLVWFDAKGAVAINEP